MVSGFEQRGTASFYGPGFQGRETANGETFDMNDMTCAHRTLPFGTVLLVRNLDNGREATVRVNDRGPYVGGRIIDLSRAAADEIGMLQTGTAEVLLRVVGVQEDE
jgi:rare lipoprotein A